MDSYIEINNNGGLAIKGFVRSEVSKPIQIPISPGQALLGNDP